MTRNLIIKNIFLGFLSWLIPFIFSCFFFKPGGELIVAYSTFKSMIMVVGTITGCILLFQYFKSIHDHFIRNGMIVGFSWLALNIIFDALILVPLMKTSFLNYILSVGICYLAIPTISIAIGYILKEKINHEN